MDSKAGCRLEPTSVRSVYNGSWRKHSLATGPRWRRAKSFLVPCPEGSCTVDAVRPHLLDAALVSRSATEDDVPALPLVYHGRGDRAHTLESEGSFHTEISFASLLLQEQRGDHTPW